MRLARLLLVSDGPDKAVIVAVDPREVVLIVKHPNNQVSTKLPYDDNAVVLDMTFDEAVTEVGGALND